MSLNSKSTRLLALAGAAVIAIGGVVSYLTTDADKETPAQEIKAESADNTAGETTNEAETGETVVAENAKTEEAAAEVATAAGGDQAAEPVKNEDGTVVEPGNPVVAVVDGKDITRVDVYRYIKAMPQNLQQLPAATIYPLALEQVVNMRLVQNKAEAANLAESEEVKKELVMAKQQIIRNLYLEEQVDKKISEGNLKKAYKELTSKIPDVKQRRASHILLENEEKAKEVIQKLNDGADFAKLAAEMSTGPTGPKGGDLGFFAKEEMVPEFASAAFEMKKGAVSKTPVKTQFGYHVIKVTDVRDQPKPTFAEVRPSLEAEERRKILDGLVQKWRKNAKIEQFDINGKPVKSEKAKN